MRAYCFWPAAFVLLLLITPCRSAEIRATYRMDWDSNPHEKSGVGRSGLVSRLFLSATGVPFRHPRGLVVLEQHAGLKRFWTAASPGISLGDVFVNRVALKARFSILGSYTADLNGQIKYKQATRTPAEESYLSSHLLGGISGQIGAGLAGRVFFQIGVDESRDIGVPEAKSMAVGMFWQYRKSRTLQASTSLTYARKTFDRFVIIARPISIVGRDLQADDLYSMRFEAQYRLFKLAYLFSNNASNSFGYSYTSHGAEGLGSRALGHGFDLHAFATFQLRSYENTDAINELVVDEYAQALALLKVARRLGLHYTLSAQLEWSRNGARLGGTFYRKRVFSVSLDAVL